MRINPYLHFKGDCAEAFAFYADVLGGKLLMTTTFAETPMAAQTPADRQGKVAHTRMVIGDQLLMGSDVPPNTDETPQGFSVSIMIDDPAEADRVFQRLAEGGTVRMPIQETFWARRFGMLTDRFGTPWMINCERTPGGERP